MIFLTNAKISVLNTGVKLTDVIYFFRIIKLYLVSSINRAFVVAVFFTFGAHKRFEQFL